MNSFAKDLISVLKSRITVIFCGIVTSIVTARYIGPAGNGAIATLLVYPELFITIGSRGISQAATYFIGQKKYSDNNVVSSLLYVWLVTSLGCLITCFVLLKFATKNEYSDFLIAIAILPIPFALFNTYCSGIFLGKNQVSEFNKINWIPNVLRLIFTVILVIVFPYAVEGAMVAIVSGYIVLSFLIYPKITQLIKADLAFDKEVVYRLLRLGSIYAISLIVISMNYQVDIMLLERLSTTYEVGIYTKGVSIVQYLWEIPTLLSTIIFARGATAKDPKEFSYKVILLLRICTIVIFVMSVIFFFMSSFVMVLLYGEEFYPSSIVQKLLIPGIWLLTIFKVLNVDLSGKGKPWIAMKAMVPSLILNVILNLLLDEKYGANGAAISSTISYSLSAILFLHFYSKEVSISVKEIYSFKKTDFEFILAFTKKFTSLNSKTKNSI